MPTPTPMPTPMPSRQPGDATPQEWQAKYDQMANLVLQTSGWEQKAATERLKDAAAGRDNAYKIAQLSAATSRYGVDAQSATAMAQLKQRAAEFEQTHGLDTAKAYTAFASTPDMVWALSDFKYAMGEAGQGFSPSPITSAAQPRAKTWGDFQALTNARQTPPGNEARPAAASGGGAASGGSGGAPAASGGGAPQAASGGGADPRLTAANSVMKALPPSDTPGNDEQDWNALAALQALYFGGRPGEVERLGGPRRKIAQAGLARLGWDPALVEWERQRGLPNQGNVRAA